MPLKSAEPAASLVRRFASRRIGSNKLPQESPPALVSRFRKEGRWRSVLDARKKISIADLRDMEVRGLLSCCADYKCSGDRRAAASQRPPSTEA